MGRPDRACIFVRFSMALRMVLYLLKSCLCFIALRGLQCKLNMVRGIVFKGLPPKPQNPEEKGVGYLVVNPEVALAEPDVLVFVFRRPAARQGGLLFIHLQGDEQLERDWE